MTETVVFLEEELRDRQTALAGCIDMYGWLSDRTRDISQEIDVIVKLLKKARGEEYGL